MRRSRRFPLGAPPLLMLLASAAAAQNQDLGPQPDSTPPRNIVLPAMGARVPMVMVNRRPTITAFINGQGPFKIAIETGARFSILLPETLKRLGFDSSATSGDNATVSLDSIRAGAVTLVGVPVVAGRFADRDIDGLLGLPAYSTVLLTLDYPAREIRFERGRLPAADGREILPLSRVGPFWGIPIRIGEVSTLGVIDTRASSVLSVVPELASRLPFDGDPVTVGMARGAAIAPVPVKRGRLGGDLAIGRYVVSHPAVSIHPLPPGFPSEPIVGTPVLQQFVLTLDQQNALVRLTRPDTLPIVIEESVGDAARGQPGKGSAGGGVPDPGFLPKFGPDGSITVLRVLPGGPAERMGVAIGDEVLEVAGRPAASLDERSWRQAVATDTVTFVFRHAGGRRELRIPTVLAHIEAGPRP